MKPSTKERERISLEKMNELSPEYLTVVPFFDFSKIHFETASQSSNN